MLTDKIKAIEIDSTGRLCITPVREEFFGIWLLGKEVHWDEKDRFLYTPAPREWTYLDWYNHILNVVEEFNRALVLTDDTEWINVPLSLKNEICISQK